MIQRTIIGLALVGVLGSLLFAAGASAGPQMTFGPENQGTLQIDYKGQFQGTARDIGSGFQNDENTFNFNFRRNRIALMGTYDERMSLYVQTEFVQDENVGPLSVASTDQGSNFQILDAVMRFSFHDALKVSVGKFKYNFSRENLEACENPLTQDRSLFLRAPFVTTRDAGVAVWGNVLQDRAQYRVDVMEGRKAVSYETAPKSNGRYSFRGHVSLLDPEKEYGYKGTYLGERKVLTVGAAYQFEPNVIFSDTQTKDAVHDYKGWTVDGFLEYPIEGIGTPTLSGAYEKVDFQDAYLAFNPDLGSVGLNGEKNGWYIKAGYMLPKLPVQVYGRAEQWRFALLNNVYDQGIDWYGMGANYYFRGQNLKLGVEASGTNFDKEGTFDGLQGTALTSKDFHTVTAQLQVIF